MNQIILAIIGSFWIVGLAEFGDKTQLIAISFMVKSKQPWIVAMGAIVGITAVTIISVTVGALFGSFLPTKWVKIAAATLFIILGVVMLISRQKEDSEKLDESTLETNLNTRKLALMSQTALFVAIAEFGDKSQLVVFTIASTGFPVAVFIGASMGMITIFLTSAIFGEFIIQRVKKSILEKLAAILFIIAGFWLFLS